MQYICEIWRKKHVFTEVVGEKHNTRHPCYHLFPHASEINMFGRASVVLDLLFVMMYGVNGITGVVSSLEETKQNTDMYSV